MKRIDIITALLFAAMLALVISIARQSDACDNIHLKPQPFESTDPHPLDINTIQNWHVTPTGAVMIVFQDGTRQLHALLSTGVCRETIKGETALTFDSEICYLVNDIPLMMFSDPS